MSEKKQQRRLQGIQEAVDAADLRKHEGYVSFSDERAFERGQLFALARDELDNVSKSDLDPLLDRLFELKDLNQLQTIDEVECRLLWMKLAVALVRSLDGRPKALTPTQKEEVRAVVKRAETEGEDLEPVYKKLAERYEVCATTIRRAYQD